MIGILISSHGKMAEGMLDTLNMFYSSELENVAALCYQESITIDDFNEKMNVTIQKINDGSGVIILTDIMGGTPMKEGIKHISDDIIMISGMNFSLLLDLVIKRNTAKNVKELDVGSIIEDAKQGIVNINEMIKEI